MIKAIIAYDKLIEGKKYMEHFSCEWKEKQQ